MEHGFRNSDNNFLRACWKCCGVHSSLKVKLSSIFSKTSICLLWHLHMLWESFGSERRVIIEIISLDLFTCPYQVFTNNYPGGCTPKLDADNVPGIRSHLEINDYIRPKKELLGDSSWLSTGRLSWWLARCQIWEKSHAKASQHTSPCILHTFPSVYPHNGKWPAPIGSWRVNYFMTYRLVFVPLHLQRDQHLLHHFYLQKIIFIMTRQLYRSMSIHRETVQCFKSNTV